MGMPYTIRFSGPSNSGKTTLICNLIEHILSKDLLVGTIKHAHHPLEVANRDGHKMAFSAPNITVGPNRTIIDWPNTMDSRPSLNQLIVQMYSHFDVVIVEGWKKYDLPTILTGTPPDNWSLPRSILACTTNVAPNWHPEIPRWSLLDVVDHILHITTS